jgi:hypothetical protein
MPSQQQTRLVADLCFTNMQGAIDAAAELEELGFTAIISQEIIDVFSASAFAEAYVDVEGDGEEVSRLMWSWINMLARRLGGTCEGVTPISPPHLHVPFGEYLEDERAIKEYIEQESDR